MDRCRLMALIAGVALTVACATAGRQSNIAPGALQTMTTTPETTPMMPGSRTPVPTDAAAMQQELRTMRLQLETVQTRAPTLRATQAQQIGEHMAALMDDLATLMGQLDRAAGQLTPEQQQASRDRLDQMRLALRNMGQVISSTAVTPAMPTATISASVTPTATMTPTGPGFGMMSREMQQMHRQLRDHAPQMDPLHTGRIAADMGDLILQLEQLMVQLAPTIDGLNAAERQAMGRTIAHMRMLTEAMAMMAGGMTPTSTPAIMATPTATGTMTATPPATATPTTPATETPTATAMP